MVNWIQIKENMKIFPNVFNGKTDEVNGTIYLGLNPEASLWDVAFATRDVLLPLNIDTETATLYGNCKGIWVAI